MGVAVEHHNTDDLEEIYGISVLRNILVPRLCFQLLPHHLSSLPNGGTECLLHILACVFYLVDVLIVVEPLYIFGFFLLTVIHVNQCAGVAPIFFLNFQVRWPGVVWIFELIDTPCRHACPLE